jgi:glyoxylase-like metal-dependent hydrolase (beta-lactamase superfamily II)
MEEDWFSQDVELDVIRIEEKQYKDHANLWFFRRPNGVFVLIDCGTGANDLHSYLRSTGLLPNGAKLSLILTHQHNDHAGGVRHFHSRDNVEVCVHKEDCEAVEKGDDEVKWGNRPDMWRKAPCQEWDAQKFIVMESGVHVNRVLLDGDVVEGLRIVHLPGHSPGCIAVLDVERRRLFTGDVIYEFGLPILTFPSSDKQRCLESMRKLKELCGLFDFAYPGHYGAVSAEFISYKCDSVCQFIQVCNFTNLVVSFPSFEFNEFRKMMPN